MVINAVETVAEAVNATMSVAVAVVSMLESLKPSLARTELNNHLC